MRIDSKGNSWIAISEFHQQSYCEVQLEFKWKGIKIETEAMKKGSLIHNSKFKTFEEKTKGHVTFDSAKLFEKLVVGVDETMEYLNNRSDKNGKASISS